ncbi:MAG: DUF4272 domain-containing protein [Thermoleophilia bacterium]
MNPPDQNEAARRALCLGALVMRSKFESIVISSSPQMFAVHEELATHLNMWLADAGLIASQSTREKPLISKALGSWSRQELIDAAWRANSLGVILWALSQFDELPPWDCQFTPQETISPLNLFAPIGPFMEKAKLRPGNEIDNMRAVAALWHWRANTRRLQDQAGDSGEIEKLAGEVREAAAAAFNRGELPELIGGDFPAFGKAFGDISVDEFNEANSIAVERHYALNWLCGYAADWDAVPTDS